MGNIDLVKAWHKIYTARCYAAHLNINIDRNDQPVLDYCFDEDTDEILRVTGDINRICFDSKDQIIALLVQSSSGQHITIPLNALKNLSPVPTCLLNHAVAILAHWDARLRQQDEALRECLSQLASWEKQEDSSPLGFHM